MESCTECQRCIVGDADQDPGPRSRPRPRVAVHHHLYRTQKDVAEAPQDKVEKCGRKAEYNAVQEQSRAGWVTAVRYSNLDSVPHIFIGQREREHHWYCNCCHVVSFYRVQYPPGLQDAKGPVSMSLSLLLSVR
jgi:hypothetical protein